ADHGLPRRADPRGVGCALDTRGRVGRAARCACRARRLPGVLVSDLVLKAEAVAAQAYAPYSNYHVGAVVRTVDGRQFAGVNVQNAAYPLGAYAEKSPIVAAATAGCQSGALATLAITASPCGGPLPLPYNAPVRSS